MRTQLLLTIIASIVLITSVSRAAWQIDGVPISATTNYQTTQAVAPDGAGGAIIAWHDFRSGTSYDIFAQRIDANGTVLWTANGVPISTGPGAQATPTIVADGAGGAIITWADDRTCCFNFDIYAQRIDASGAVLWTTNGVALCTVAKDQIGPQLVADGTGGAIVVWEDGRVSGLNTGIFAQRMSAAGVPQWTANGVALCTAPNNQYLPKVVADGAGGAVVTWTDFRIGGVSDIFVQRVNASGAALWTANGVDLSGPASSEYSPSIAADGAGGAIVTWQDFRTGLSDIFAQRVDATGAPQWTADGVAISTTGWDVHAQVVSDGAGGAIVAWSILEPDEDEDEIDEYDHDVYAQRVDAAGAIQWAPGGTALATGMGNQFATTIIPDGFGGAMVAWEDSLATNSINYDIRAQRVNAAGATQWTAGGVAVSAAVNEQRRPVMLPDGSGGAIVAWEDFRNGSNMDIFAMQVDADGGVLVTGIGNTPPASVVTLRSNYPNPFSTATTFEIDLSADADVTVDVYDVAGRRVRHMDVGRLSAGARGLPFNGAGNDGRPLPSGVYFYRVSANGATVTQKMVIAR